MVVDVLQRVFKTLTDPTRIRILALLEQHELPVQDLVQILGVAQSTVSRHLAILRDAGLLRERREGTYSYHRFVPPTGGDWRDAWRLASNALGREALARRDRDALEALLRERTSNSRSWFDSIGPEWDALRQVFNDDVQRARAIGKLVPRGMTVADIGTGTGILAQDLARAGVSVIAVDHSRRMLATARTKLAAAGIDTVELRHGDATQLPLSDGEVDGAFAHMVLHYVAAPLEALREMARVVRPGGRVVVVDFEKHELDWLERELGVLWRGFPTETISGWLVEVGLADVEVELIEPSARGRDLPATFIASAYRPR
jgi:ArsR family transcriptional regulator